MSISDQSFSVKIVASFNIHLWVVPKGLLTFLGFLGNADFSPWKIFPEFNELIVIVVFLR